MKKLWIVVVVLAIVTMLFTGCFPYNESSSTPGASPSAGDGTTSTPAASGPTTGTVQVLVTDAPGDVSSVNITFTEVEIHKARSDNASGSWISLNVTNEQPFNLMALQDGLTLTLAEGNEVGAGDYTQLRMTVSDVVVCTEDGPEGGYPADIPSGTLKFVRPFTLEAGGTISLLVDFDVAKSVVFTGASKNHEPKVIFKPTVKLSIEGKGPTTKEEPEPGEEELTLLPEPTAAFDPSSGPAGTSIAVMGTDWTVGDNITSVAFGSEAAAYGLLVDASGNLTGNITVPVGLVPGVYDIIIEGNTSGSQTFSDAFTVTPTAVFDPASGPPATLVNVSGAGWAAGDNITSVKVGVEPAAFALLVNDEGALSGNITIPNGLAATTYEIVIDGDSSGNQAFPDAFEVTP